MTENRSNIHVEITDASEFHRFRLVFNPQSAPGERIEIMLHARSLVDLIHQGSTALCEWQKQTTTMLICQKTGFTEEEARKAGLIA
jgi:hypothetical protein